MGQLFRRVQRRAVRPSQRQAEFILKLEDINPNADNSGMNLIESGPSGLIELGVASSTQEGNIRFDLPHDACTPYQYTPTLQNRQRKGNI